MKTVRGISCTTFKRLTLIKDVCLSFTNFNSRTIQWIKINFLKRKLF